MEITKGKLVLVNINTSTPEVFWNGVKVPNILKIVVRNDDDDSDVKLVVGELTPALVEMQSNGINVKVRGEK